MDPLYGQGMIGQQANSLVRDLGNLMNFSLNLLVKSLSKKNAVKNTDLFLFLSPEIKIHTHDSHYAYACVFCQLKIFLLQPDWSVQDVLDFLETCRNKFGNKVDTYRL